MIWSVIGITVADNINCTPTSLRFTTLRALRCLLQNSEERQIKMQNIPQHLLKLMKIYSIDNGKGVNNIEERININVLPHFRSFMFDDMLAECIKLACDIDISSADDNNKDCRWKSNEFIDEFLCPKRSARNRELWK